MLKKLYRKLIHFLLNQRRKLTSYLIKKEYPNHIMYTIDEESIELNWESNNVEALSILISHLTSSKFTMISLKRLCEDLKKLMTEEEYEAFYTLIQNGILSVINYYGSDTDLEESENVEKEELTERPLISALEFGG